MKNFKNISLILLIAASTQSNIVAMEKTYQDNCNQLLQAAYSNDIETITTLIQDNKIDPDIHDDMLQTPLHKACIKGNIEAAETLINNKARVNVKDTWGNTPFYFACYNCYKEEFNIDIVKLLVSHHADINAQNISGRNALIEACDVNNEELILFLIEKGADTTVQTEDRRSPIEYARLRGNKKIVQFIKEIQKMESEEDQ